MKKRFPRRAATLLAATCALASRPPALRAAGEVAARDFAVRACKVITMNGPDFAPGVVVVQGGRIAAVGGADTRVPPGIPVVEAGDQVLMPGFIEAHGQRGLDRTFETALDASFVRVTDGINPVSLEVEDARRNGITTMLVAPDNQAFLAGRAAIVHPQGISIDAMIVKQDAALKISLLPTGGSSRMGHLARLRQVLDDTRRYLDQRRHQPVRRGSEPPDEIEPTRKALVDLLEGRLPALVYCPTAADVSTCFGLAKEYGFRVIPIVGPDAWRAAELLRTNNVPVIVSPQVDTWERQPDGSVSYVNLPKVLADAGVPFALTTDPADLGAQHPWFQAAVAVRAGVPRDVALAAITKVPARILGFGSRKGVIAKGADADFLLLSDDPLSGRTWVDESYIRGARVYARAVDEKLQRLLHRTSEPPLAASELDHQEGDDDPESVPRTGRPVEDELLRRWPAGGHRS